MATIDSIGFTAGGIDASAIVTQLMAIERNPLTAMKNRQTRATNEAAAIDGLRQQFDAIRRTAASLNGQSTTRLRTASSNPAAVSVQAGSSAVPGSVSFTVDRLASAHSLRTAFASTSPTAPVVTAARLALSTTASSLGIGTIGVADPAATPGSRSVVVTQASTAATRTTAVAPSTSIDASNDSLEVTVAGSTATVTLAHGTYSSTALAGMLGTAFAASGVGVTAAVTGPTGIEIRTHGEGSAATLDVVGGSALMALGLVAGDTARGTDGVVTVDGVATTVTDARAGVTVAGGSLTLGLTGGLRLGTAQVAVVSTGDRSMAAVAAAVNAAGVGTSASVVRVGDDRYHLQFTSDRAGTAAALALDPSAITGGLLQVSAAQDARLTVGSGTGAFTVDASGNTFADLLAGTTVTVAAVGATPVTVSVERDPGAAADAVGRLVDQVNVTLGQISALTGYNTATRVSGPLASNSAVRRSAQQLREAVTGLVDERAIPANVGITTTRAGTLGFDRALFLRALESDPTVVSRVLTESGTSTGPVSFVDAADTTAPGSYAVEVTRTATRAQVVGPRLDALVAGQQIVLGSGTVTTTYTVPPAASAADVVAGLQSAVDAAGLRLDVRDTAGSLSVTARAHGSAASFTHDFDAAAGAGAVTASGVDVAGLVNGAVASGNGLRLTVPADAANEARGLVVDVAPDAALGASPVEYRAGLAARTAFVLGRLADANGALSSQSYSARGRALQVQMDRYELRLADRDVALRRQWSAIQSTLQSLQSQSSWLSSRVNPS